MKFVGKLIVRLIWIAGGLAMMLGSASNAKAAGDRDKLNGSWAPRSSANPGETRAQLWTFRAEGSVLHVIETDGEKKIADFMCDTKSGGCEVKIDGKRTMVYLWFDGSRLMEIETRTSETLERSFTILPEGDAMEMKIIPLVLNGKIETFQYKRVQLSAQSK